MTNAENPALNRTLGPLMMWGLGVGYVISGEYFGWNLGLPLGGTYGMLAATALVTVMYVAFVLSYAELSCAIPRAGGAFVYAERAFGRRVAFVAGLVQIFEFVFAPPAIAMAIGAYLAQGDAQLDPRVTATLAYLVFTALNIWGVKQAAFFELFVTVLAVGELVIFIAVVLPSFQWVEFSRNPLPNGWGGAFGCIPFAIWFYLAIEGVANAAEEAKDPARTLALGFGGSLVTLVVLAIGVYFAAVGVAGWEAVVFDPPGSATTSDAPLPLALRHVVDPKSALYTALLAIGLFGLVASFHGIILAAGRAVMAFGAASYAPKALGIVWAKTRTPAVALLVNMVVGIVAIWSGRTSDIITLSCFGALSLYMIAMLSLFGLRKREPALERHYRAPLYPWFPALALILALLCFVAMLVYYPAVACFFLVLLAVGVALDHFFGSARNGFLS